MKKNHIWYLAAGALLLGACSTDPTEWADDMNPTPAEGAEIELFGVHPETKTLGGGSRVAIAGDRAVWSEQDSIGVFNAASTAPAKFLLTSGAGTAEGTFAGKIGYEEGDKLYVLVPYAAENPYLLDEPEPILPTAAKIGFNGQMQDGFGPQAEAHLGRYAYMASKPVELVDGRAQLQLSYLAVKMSFEFSLPEAATVRFLTMSVDQNILYDKGVVDLTADAPAAKGWGTPSRCLTVGFKNGAVTAGQTVTAHMMMLPADLSDKKVTFYVSAERADGTPVTYTTSKPKGLNFEVATSYTAEVSGLAAYDTHIPMVYVPGGSLNICGLGVDGLTPQQILDKDYKVNSFWIGRTEVTNQQYCDFLNVRNPASHQLGAWLAGYMGVLDDKILQIEQKGGKWVPKSGPILSADGETTTEGSYADYPMIGVTHTGAAAYSWYMAHKILGYPDTEKTEEYLPSEAQWEYAATGSEWNPEAMYQFFAGGNDPDELMWSCQNCDSEGSSCLGLYVGNGDDPNAMSPSGSFNGGTHPVAKLKPNYLGIYDMSGNVSELCADWFNSANFPYGTALDPRCKDISAADDYYGDETRAVRGGFWQSFASNGFTFSRDAVIYNYYSTTMGFRFFLPLR